MKAKKPTKRKKVVVSSSEESGNDSDEVHIPVAKKAASLKTKAVSSPLKTKPRKVWSPLLSPHI